MATDNSVFNQIQEIAILSAWIYENRHRDELSDDEEALVRALEKAGYLQETPQRSTKTGNAVHPKPAKP